MVAKELVVITGMSGAGRSTVAHSLEDLGWYVVDNLPPALLPSLAEQSFENHTSLAVVVDVRGGTAEAFGAEMRDDHARYGRIVKEFGIKAD